MLTIGAALGAFLAGKQNIKAKTRAGYQWECERFIAWLSGQGIEELADVTATHIRDYFTAEAARGLRPGSVHVAAVTIKAFFNWLEREELLPGKNPMRKVEMPKLPRELLPALTVDEVAALLEAAAQTSTPERDTAVVLTLVDTGVRAAELCGLRWRDVNLGSGRVFVHAGKGDKDRYVFLGVRTRAALQAYKLTRPDAGPGGPVFERVRCGAGGLAYGGLKSLLFRLATAAGVVGVHAHAFRRAFAVEMLRDGADLVRLSRLLGHADLTMLTRHYLPLLTDDLADAHRRHSPGDHLPA